MKKLRRLRAKLSAADRISVEREGYGRINGVAVITEGPALGHGFEIDALTIEQVTGALDGLPGRWTHGNLCEDGLGKHLGKWENPRIDVGGGVNRTLADFVFSESAHSIRPDGLTVSAPEYLMDRAEEDPSSFGVSIVGHLSMEKVDISLEDEDENLIEFARLDEAKDLKRGDFVADPAANPTGLSLFAGTPSELAEEGTDLLARVVEKFGKDKVLSFLGTAGFLDDQDLRQQVTNLSTELATVRLQNIRYESELAAHKVNEVEEYIESLATASVDYEAPFKAEQLQNIRDLFDAGQEDVARQVGTALLAVAKAHGQKEFLDSKTVVLSKPSEKETKQRKHVQVTAEMLRSTGWDVSISADELSYVCDKRK